VKKDCKTKVQEDTSFENIIEEGDTYNNQSSQKEQHVSIIGHSYSLRVCMTGCNRKDIKAPGRTTIMYLGLVALHGSETVALENTFLRLLVFSQMLDEVMCWAVLANVKHEDTVRESVESWYDEEDPDVKALLDSYGFF